MLIESKQKRNFLLFLIILLSIFIRTSNMDNLGDNLLGADSYLFHRYSEAIIETGSVPKNDTMRYYPFGFETNKELILHSYVIAFIFKITNFFLPSLKLIKITQLYPVLFASLSLISFYFLTKEIFSNKKIALISTTLLSVTPAFLFRTSAGFADKEPLGIFLIITTYLFFLKAINSKTSKKYYYAVVSGISTGLTSLTTGMVAFIFLPIGIFILFLIILGKMTKKDYFLLILWFLSLSPFMIFATQRYGGFNFYNQFMLQPILIIPFLAISKLLIKKKSLLLSLIFISILVLVLFLHKNFISDNINSTLNLLTLKSNPHSESILENSKPSLFGSFSWYNGFNFILIPYILGLILIVYNLKNKFSKPLFLLLVWNILSFIAGMNSIRNLFPLTPSIIIIASYFIHESFQSKRNTYAIFVIALLCYLPMFYLCYNSASNFNPAVNDELMDSFDQIRENTEDDAVFLSWWDYGYLIQTLANRTTVLDGGNFESPTYVATSFFTSTNETEYIELLNHYGNPDYLFLYYDDIKKFRQISGIAGKEVELKIDYESNNVIIPESAENMLFVKLFIMSHMNEELNQFNLVYQNSKIKIWKIKKEIQ